MRGERFPRSRIERERERERGGERERERERGRERERERERGSTILLQHAFSFCIIDKAPIYPHATTESLCRPPFHSLINTNKTDAWLTAHTHTHTHTERE